MVQFGDSSVAIVVDGEPLPEFDVKVSDDAKTISCWIPSEEGKAFLMRYSRSHGKVTTSADLYLDGKWIGGPMLRSDTDSQAPLTRDYAYAPVTFNEGKPFWFSFLNITDDDESLPNTNGSLGEIKVMVYEIEALDKLNTLNPLPDLNLTVHERAKKAVVHGIKLGEAVPNITTLYASKRHALLVTFIFRYRPIETLRADGIAPPAPKAPPKPEDIIDLSEEVDSDVEEAGADEEIQRLELELQRLKERKDKKRKRGASDVQVKREIKREVKLEPIIIL